MTGDTAKMRDAASQVSAEEKKYKTAIENIDDLIVNKLSQCWVDEAYDDLKTQYTGKSKADLNDLDILLNDFYESLNIAADDLDTVISSLR